MDSTPSGSDVNETVARALNALQAGRTCSVEDFSHNLSLLPSDQAQGWLQNGFFILRSLLSPELCAEMSAVAIDLFARAANRNASYAGHHLGADGVVAVEEAARVQSSDALDARMSKLFNLHRQGLFREFASHPEILNAMRAILGPNVSCFNSQYIFKNPGVWGQPWHQDSLYYRFSRMPQVGVWLATSRATVENGCLVVAPGSHLEPIHEVVPDTRPGANFGYVEVVDYDFSRAEPVLMAPGDVLIFHSFLMHKSNDNTADDRRSALVLHYADSATEIIGDRSATIDFMPILRAGRPTDTATIPA